MARARGGPSSSVSIFCFLVCGAKELEDVVAESAHRGASACRSRAAPASIDGGTTDTIFANTLSFAFVVGGEDLFDEEPAAPQRNSHLKFSAASPETSSFFVLLLLFFVLFLLAHEGGS